jgi:hypothetical protein
MEMNYNLEFLPRFILLMAAAGSDGHMITGLTRTR